MTTYVDVSGVKRNLTTLQGKYLTTLARQGHLPLETAYDARNQATFNRLQERGLAVGVEWHCPLSPECLTEITELGRVTLQMRGKK